MTNEEKLMLLQAVALMQMQVFVTDELIETKLATMRIKDLSLKLRDEILHRHGKNIASLWSVTEGEETNHGMIELYTRVIEQIAKDSVEVIKNEIIKSNELHSSNSDNLS